MRAEHRINDSMGTRIYKGVNARLCCSVGALVNDCIYGQ